MIRLALLMLGGCCFVPQDHMTPTYDPGDDPHSPQRMRQGITRDLQRCLSTPMAQEHNAEALRCKCRAEEACIRGGLDYRCAWDDWVLETRGHYPVIVGRCEDR